MDVIKSVQNYVSKMINDVTGMKVLLLDIETTPIVSLVTTQSWLLSKECYLIDRVDNRNRDKMRHLKCVCFLRPTQESIQWLVEELKEPCYGDYYLYFSNTLKKSAIERLAEVDEHEVVREIQVSFSFFPSYLLSFPNSIFNTISSPPQEYYGDYLAVNPDFFSLDLHQPEFTLFGESLTQWNSHTFERTVQGVVSVLLSLKKKPVIRYERVSAMAKRLAQEVQYQIQQEGQLFDFRRTDTPPLLLILDRRNDPVTPLLSQWTYQAMVHEMIGITKGRVDLSGVPDIKNELKEIVLSADQDPFFKKSMYLNLGDLGANIKLYVDEYQTKTKSNMSIESIADMKRFVEEYPEFRKLSGNVSKHVALVGELSRRVAQEEMLECSEVEQSLACVERHGEDLKVGNLNIQRLIENPKVTESCKLRLVLLYALRYEKSPQNNIVALIELLQKHGVSERRTAVCFVKGSGSEGGGRKNGGLGVHGWLIPNMIHYAGTDQRQDDLFSNQTLLSRGKSAFKGLKGVENVYTQHTPHLAETLEALVKGKIKETSYPFVEGTGSKDRPQDIIIFIIGGTTYEEARYIAQLNASTPGARFVLGGTCVHNSTSFLHDVEEIGIKYPAPTPILAAPTPGSAGGVAGGATRGAAAGTATGVAAGLRRGPR
ncbi:Sec1-like protein [Endogone sp. FLAS-F59071]|nr:Sec1-like protein [Endogone sp. FLAS-F59071]|eukprot:RUS23094.1 Sec1-like protein [Endogone sp. FLAS-F59071]